MPIGLWRGWGLALLGTLAIVLSACGASREALHADLTILPRIAGAHVLVSADDPPVDPGDPTSADVYLRWLVLVKADAGSSARLLAQEVTTMRARGWRRLHYDGYTREWIGIAPAGGVQAQLTTAENALTADYRGCPNENDCFPIPDSDRPRFGKGIAGNLQLVLQKHIPALAIMLVPQRHRM